MMRYQSNLAELLLLLILQACANFAAPRDLATAEQTWRAAGIENYTLDIAVDGCSCGGPEPLRYSVVVTNGEKTSETDPPGEKPGYAPTVEDLFRQIEANEPYITVTYNKRRCADRDETR